MRQHTLKIVDGEISHPLMRLNKTLNFHFDFDEHIAIIGPNGAGKSILVDVLLGKYPLKKGTIKYDFTPSASTAIYENIQYLEFRDGYGMADSSYYYQQRWNSWDYDVYPTVEEFIGDQINHSDNQAVLDLFQLKALFSKKMLFLSSGELRTVQLAKALLKDPRILILDNPLIGLDVKTRDVLLELLNRLSET
ncbi:MAG: ATP-binding cassette domain-containing protein, partial [Bacteroides sp.]|nr:ATP-binding cassette domain-containing protein [Bacteroides sp.]